ncbi:GNAT family N-acetyltransferase [Kineothrix sedimenti]|uniref:GNAT family N-acetyltransferase n=1 Tax=Kineothrix sedimenti TaxID=3123317 RepID=A0ABZ3EWD5_9FIRM
MNRKILPVRWQYENIIIREATIRDEDKLIQICNSWEDKEEVEGHTFSDDYIHNCLEGKFNLPPLDDADNKYCSFKVIEDQDRQVIGLLDIYHGYPDKECLWIGLFIMDKQFQGNGLGTAAIKSLLEEAAEKEWKACGLGVYLKNLKGVSFWIHNGFKEIGNIYGEKHLSSDFFPLISLFRKLS